MKNVIHCTDLYRPHSDFDDVGDAMAMFALHCMWEINLLAFVLDQPAEQERRPGKVTVDELNKICGTSIPSIAGYHALLNLLQTAPKGVVVTIVGSCSDLYWAYKTNPALVRDKVGEVWIFAGDAKEQAKRGHMEGRDFAPPYGLEHNVATDPYAFIALMRSDLKIVWIPCYDGGEVKQHSDGVNQISGSYWLGHYDTMLSKSSHEVLDFFIRALSEERGDGQLYNWSVVRNHYKEFWGVDIFRAINKPVGNYPFRFRLVKIHVNDNATVRIGVGHKAVLLFEKTSVNDYYGRMNNMTAELFSNIGKVQDIPAPPEGGDDSDNGVKIVKDIIPVGRGNRPANKMTPRWITIHDTGNSKVGAGARNHASYLKGDAAANAPVSWHFTVDSKEIYQHLPLDENAWHAGDSRGPGNMKSIGIEICMNSDGDRFLAEEHAAWLCAKLIGENASLEPFPACMKQHFDWSGKNCPQVLRSRPGGWDYFLDRVRAYLDEEVDNVGGTPITGLPRVTTLQMQAWARNRKAHQRFVDIAPVYWAYGEQTGINPEVLYCQSAKETAFGRYTGAVPPDYNNWAGIKTSNASGDKPEDHQRFVSPEDGVRGHFNHISAYVGLSPIGEPHPRYHVVMRTTWAGTIRTVEQLGGKWAPAASYGQSIVEDYLDGLLATEEGDTPVPVDPPPVGHCENCHWLEGENRRLTRNVAEYTSRMSQIYKIAKDEFGR